MTKFPVTALAAGFVVATATAGEPQALERKLIACGHEFYPRSPTEVLAHADQFDRTGLNGVQLMLSGTLPDGRTISTKTLPLDPEWPADAFAAEIPALRKMSEHRGLRDSCLLLFRTPDRRIAWTDDAAWTRVAWNMRVLARIAKEGGIRGFLMDTEDYPQQCQFKAMPGDPAYGELAPLVRRRAQDLFRGVFEEQPEAVVLSFWLLTQSLGGAMGTEPSGSLETSGDVWPAFVNGILDVIPPSAKLVDGCEWAYNYEAERDEFVKSSLWQRENALAMVAPENRTKYRGQVLASSGHYMDRYLERDPKAYWYAAPVEGSYLRHLERNLVQASEASGGYVWFWCEKRCWVKWDGKLEMFAPHVSHRTWEDELPGLSKMLSAITFPGQFARERVKELKQANALVNLVPDDAIESGLFKTWEDSSPWLHASKGTFGVDRTTGDGDKESLMTTGVGAGGYKYAVKNAKGGEIYLIRVSAKGENPYVYVEGWDMSRWYRGLPGCVIPLKPVKGSDWLHGTAFVRVPDNTIAFTVYLNSRNTKSGRNWFDNLEVYRIWGGSYPDVTTGKKGE